MHDQRGADGQVFEGDINRTKQFGQNSFLKNSQIGKYSPAKVTANEQKS